MILTPPRKATRARGRHLDRPIKPRDLSSCPLTAITGDHHVGIPSTLALDPRSGSGDVVRPGADTAEGIPQRVSALDPYAVITVALMKGRIGVLHNRRGRTMTREDLSNQSARRFSIGSVGNSYRTTPDPTLHRSCSSCRTTGDRDRIRAIGVDVV